MKKVLAIGLSLMVLMSLFVGCGGSEWQIKYTGYAIVEENLAHLLSIMKIYMQKEMQ